MRFDVHWIELVATINAFLSVNSLQKMTFLALHVVVMLENIVTALGD